MSFFWFKNFVATPLDYKYRRINTRDGWNNLHSYVEIPLTIYLTLTATVASCEEVFSKIKVIKKLDSDRLLENNGSRIYQICLSNKLHEHDVVCVDTIKNFASGRLREIKFDGDEGGGSDPDSVEFLKPWPKQRVEGLVWQRQGLAPKLNKIRNTLKNFNILNSKPDLWIRVQNFGQ